MRSRVFLHRLCAGSHVSNVLILAHKRLAAFLQRIFFSLQPLHAPRRLVITLAGFLDASSARGTSIGISSNSEMLRILFNFQQSEHWFGKIPDLWTFRVTLSLSWRLDLLYHIYSGAEGGFEASGEEELRTSSLRGAN